jgi:SpoIID/LytB domain protein
MIAALAAAVGMVGVAPTAHADVDVIERLTVPASGSITIAGRGFGHGIGLSQYGARAAGASGVSYEQILNFYYPGTSSTTQTHRQIRVMLMADTDDELRVIATSGMTMTDGNGTTRTLGFSGASATQWRVLRNANNTGMVIFGLVNGSWRLWSTSGPSPAPVTLASSGGTVRVIAPNGTRTEYRGTVRAVNDGAAPNIRSVNVVPMEDYLRSVVPSEVPATWPTQTLQAQTVAARTYASLERHNSSARQWDTCDTTACQVYKGYRTYSSSGSLVSTNEHANTNAAITATANRIRTYGGVPALTQFSASNGGWTAAGSAPYLVAKQDSWDGQGNPVHTWSTAVTSTQIRNAFPSVGTPRTITVTSRNGFGMWGGRVVSVTVAGSTGSTTISGAAFRTAFGLRSAWWKLTGSTRHDPDFTANAKPDLLARTPGGAMRVYEGTGAGGFSGTSPQIGSGWQIMRLVLRAGDMTSDGNPDVLAVTDTGTLRLYRSNGAGKFGTVSTVGTGWQSMRSVAGPGDFDGDGKADVVAIDPGGRLLLYSGRGDGTVAAGRVIGGGWEVMTALLGAGDMNGDGASDLVARHRDGRLLLYRGDGRGGFLGTDVIGTGWQVMSLMTVSGDWSGDGRPDILASRSDGVLYLYPWTGSGFQDIRPIGSGWQIYNAIL